MVATDTVVGVVGAVVLVAAMAGVFAYEYNNTPGGDGHELPERFEHLDPHGDIDGDGVLNELDDDMDGDGVPNDEDEDTVVTETSSGSVGPRVEPAMSDMGTFSTTLEDGIRGVHVTATFSPTASDPTGTLSAFQLTATLEDGTQVGMETGPGELSISSTEVIAGGLDIVVQAAQGALGGDYQLTVELVY